MKVPVTAGYKKPEADISVHQKIVLIAAEKLKMNIQGYVTIGNVNVALSGVNSRSKG